MGACILWIVFFHTKILFPGWLAPLEAVRDYGFAAVDIFFLLSGIGMVFSLRKTPCLAHFYRKRVLRLVPTYWLFIVASYALRMVFGSTQPIEVVYALFGLDFFVYGSLSTWFVPALLLLYIVTPPLYWAFQKLGSYKALALFTTITVMLTQLISSSEAAHLMIFTTRIPVFLLGLCIGMKMEKDDTTRTRTILPLCLLAIMVLGATLIHIHNIAEVDNIYQTALPWHLTALLSLPLAVVLSRAIEAGKNTIGAFLRFFGGLSLELYIVHMFLFELLLKLPFKQAGWNLARVPEYAFGVALSVLGALALQKTTKLAVLGIRQRQMIRKDM